MERYNEIRQENKNLLEEFEGWLEAKGLSRRVIASHLNNISFFLDEYLAGEEKRPSEVDEFDVDDFLGNWFIRKTLWSSESAIKGMVASLVRFYQFMAEVRHMDAEEAEEILMALEEGQPIYLRRMERYESFNPDGEDWFFR